MIALACLDYLLDIAHQRLKKLLLALIDGLDLFKLAMQLLKPVVKLPLIHCRDPYEGGRPWDMFGLRNNDTSDALKESKRYFQHSFSELLGRRECIFFRRQSRFFFVIE